MQQINALPLRTILVVDDDELARRAMARGLRALGYGAMFARDGAEALALFEAHRGAFAMVLLDLIMPTMDGFECAERLRAVAPSCPIVICTGLGTNAAVLPPDGDAVLAKPFQLDELQGMLERFLRWRSSGVRRSVASM